MKTKSVVCSSCGNNLSDPRRHHDFMLVLKSEAIAPNQHPLNAFFFPTMEQHFCDLKCVIPWAEKQKEETE